MNHRSAGPAYAISRKEHVALPIIRDNPSHDNELAWNNRVRRGIFREPGAVEKLIDLALQETKDQVPGLVLYRGGGVLTLTPTFSKIHFLD